MRMSRTGGEVFKKDRKKSWQIFQNHHLVYPDEGEELTVKVSRTEHFFLGRITPYAKAHGLSSGFLKSIKFLRKKYKRNKKT